MAVMNWLKKVAGSALDPNKELRVQELKRVVRCDADKAA
jgi:hypothetical protein